MDVDSGHASPVAISTRMVPAWLQAARIVLFVQAATLTFWGVEALLQSSFSAGAGIILLALAFFIIKSAINIPKFKGGTYSFIIAIELIFTILSFLIMREVLAFGILGLLWIAVLIFILATTFLYRKSFHTVNNINPSPALPVSPKEEKFKNAGAIALIPLGIAAGLSFLYLLFYAMGGVVLVVLFTGTVGFLPQTSNAVAIIEILLAPVSFIVSLYLNQQKQYRWSLGISLTVLVLIAILIWAPLPRM